MNTNRRSLSISVLVVCGCSTPRADHAHPETTSSRSATFPTTSDEPADAAAAVEEAAQRKYELLVPTKEFDKDPETEALLVTFEDLNLKKVLGMERVTEDVVTRMPEWMQSLDGKQVRIRGYMYPTYEAEDISRFVLIDDNRIMDFGPNWPYECIEVKLKEGTTTSYVPATRSFDVVGRFKIELVIPEGNIVGLFRIDEAVIPTVAQ